MKTPQEQAEDKFNAVAQRFDSECMGKLPDYRAELYLIQKQEIPLTELIAVAQAGKAILDAETEQEHSAAKYNATIALEALRATEKVEL